MKYDSPKVFQFEDIKFWAEGGRVVILNTVKAEDESAPLEKVIRTIEPKEFLKRAIAVWVMNQAQPPSQIRKVNKLREEAEIVVKEALKQAAALGINEVIKLAGPPELVIPGARYTFRKKSNKEILLDGYEIQQVIQ